MQAQYTENGNIRVEGGGKVRIVTQSAENAWAEIMQMESDGDLTIAPHVPPTQAEIDAAQQAELDDLAAQIDTGRSIIRSLGVEVFQLAKAADPTLTASTFKQRIRDRLEGF